MWISCDPRSGRLDAYPPCVQEKLNAWNGSTSHVDLGRMCFNATVHFNSSDGTYTQKTPGIPNAKPPGRRSVMNATSNRVKLYVNQRQYFLYGAEDAFLDWRDVPEIEDGHYVWQWCTETSLAKALDNDWIPYQPDVDSQIEEAFTTNQDSTLAQVGTKRIQIVFDGNGPFYKQLDIDTGNRRWIRRHFLKVSQRNKIAMHLKKDVPENELCCLCLEEFSESEYVPTTKIRCGHVMHSACFDGYKQRGSRTCPLCRQEF